MYDTVFMKAKELIRRLRKYARKNGLGYEEQAGRGDHVRIWVGERRSELPGRRGEIKTKTFFAICKQLGIDPEDL